MGISGSTRGQSINISIITAIAAPTADRFEMVIFNQLALLRQFNPELEVDMLMGVIKKALG